ncbi:MAG: acyl--CoA ligase [Hyphomicrobiales bacterium]|nr:acyl--CoA ligase [Hyphomicrobiales bacterium]MBV9427916.1 acyl--CoA ligase [Bradyrhizobiaceae bacterium]
MPQRSLRDWLYETANGGERFLHGRSASVALADLIDGSSLGGDLAALDGACVLVLTRDQLTAALALIELDGVARRMILCPADFAREHLPVVIAKASVDAIVSDEDAPDLRALNVPLHVTCTPAIAPDAATQPGRRPTEWILFTSGTTGIPKMVVHTLASLTSAIKPRPRTDARLVWATFYDIRRYGGLQILLRAVLDGGSLVLSDAQEPIGEHLARLGRHGATHVTGTPSHWRRVLMSPAAHAMAPGYVRLSGEIADQAVLDNLRALYPQARVVHAFASTEAGVGFEVADAREGVPASTIADPGNGAKLKIDDGSLRISSPGNAARYLGDGDLALAGLDGFVDTNDMMELRDGRYYFVGRRGRIVNVGGLKVHPEEVEAVINRHPAVRISLVHPRRNPITGSVVVADVVLRDDPETSDGPQADKLRGEIVELCRGQLARHKVPAAVRFVPSLTFSASGKLARTYA